MGKEITDLQQMMQTLATASTDPNAVSVGDFAKAVQSLQAELKMLEEEVSRLGDTVGGAFNANTAAHEGDDASEIVAEPAAHHVAAGPDGVAQAAAAAKP